MDSRGIPGWDEVDHLAQALISLDGICVTNTQAQNIQSLYSELMDFDKHHLKFTSRTHGPVRGRFGRSKAHRSAHVTADTVKR